MIRTTLICATPDLNKVLPRNIPIKDRKTFCVLHVKLGDYRSSYFEHTLFGNLYPYVYRKAKDRQELDQGMIFFPNEYGKISLCISLFLESICKIQRIRFANNSER